MEILERKNKKSNMRLLAENKGISFYLFIFLFFIYLFTAQGNNINSSDQQEVRFETTRSIVEKGELAIPDGMGVKGNYGKDYSWYGIGQPIIAIPFYITGKFLEGAEGAEGTVSLINQTAIALSGVILFLFIIDLGYSKKTALTVTFFYAFGTIAWPYSKHPFDHPIEMLSVLLAVFCAHLFVKTRAQRYLLLSSISLGVAFLTRPPAVFALPPIFILLTFSRLTDLKKEDVFAGIRDCAVYSMVFLPFVAVQLWYNYARFGSIYETGITLMAVKAGIDFFSGTPLLRGLAGFLYSPGKGFFYYSPIAILIFLSIRGFYNRYPGLSICFIGISVSYLLFLSRNIYWHGDWCWGPRYLLVIAPLLMIPVADFVERVDGKLSKGAVIILFGISICVQIIGVSVDFSRYFASLQVDKGVRFTVVGGNSVPYIIEPPAGTHFEWDKSPIAYQAAAAVEIWEGLKEQPFSHERKVIHSKQEALRDYIKYKTFDFWWLYALDRGASPSPIILILSLLLFIITFSLIRVLKMVKG